MILAPAGKVKEPLWPARLDHLHPQPLLSCASAAPGAGTHRMIEPQPLEYTALGSQPYLAHSEFNPSPVHRNRLACIVSLVRAGGPPERNRILEIGCGVGNIAIPIASLGYHITAIDIHGPSIETVRRRSTFPSLEALHKPFEDMSLSDFDTIILTEVLEHVPDCEAMLSRICTGMRPGSRLVLTVPNGWSSAELLCRPSYALKRAPFGAAIVKLVKRLLRTRDLTTANEQTPHVHFFTLPRMEDMFDRHGLSVAVFHRYFVSWLLRETFFSERGANEDVARRDFERSQRTAPRACALWAFLLEKKPRPAG